MPRQHPELGRRWPKSPPPPPTTAGELRKGAIAPPEVPPTPPAEESAQNVFLSHAYSDLWQFQVASPISFGEYRLLRHIHSPESVGPLGQRESETQSDRVPVDLPRRLVDQVAAKAGPRGVSAYIQAAIRAELQHDRLGLYLDELDAQLGPVSPGLIGDIERQIAGE
jgi:hypothetical protein